MATADLNSDTRCLVFFVDIANLGMANIALPTIQKALGYDEGSVQWILTAYSLTVSSIPQSLSVHKIYINFRNNSLVAFLWLEADLVTFSVTKMCFYSV